MKNLLLAIIFTLSLGNVSATENQSRMNAEISLNSIIGIERSGCCSWHGGVSYCGYMGKYICNDGWTSGCSCN
jgi:hypothetical protein